MEYIALLYNTRAFTLWTSFGGGIWGCQREPHSTTTCATSLKLMRVHKLSSQVTDKKHILSMIRSISISQTGKGSTVVKMGTLQ